MQKPKRAPLFDPKKIAAVTARSAAINKPDAGFLVRLAAETITDRISVTNREFDVAADLWSKFGIMKQALLDCQNVGRVIQVGHGIFGNSLHGTPDIVADMNQIPLEPDSLALATSVFALHRSNNLHAILHETLKTLKPDGLFSACLPGSATLQELRECLIAAESELTGNATMRIEPFGEVRQYGDLLQRAGFKLPVVDSDLLTVRYKSLRSLIDDLRAMGANSALTRTGRFLPHRDLINRAEEIYRRRYSDADGKIRVSVELVYLSGWSPHASQQTPAKRGSASHALKDFL